MSTSDKSQEKPKSKKLPMIEFVAMPIKSTTNLETEASVDSETESSHDNVMVCIESVKDEDGVSISIESLRKRLSKLETNLAKVLKQNPKIRKILHKYDKHPKTRTKLKRTLLQEDIQSKKISYFKERSRVIQEVKLLDKVETNKMDNPKVAYSKFKSKQAKAEKIKRKILENMTILKTDNSKTNLLNKHRNNRGDKRRRDRPDNLEIQEILKDDLKLKSMDNLNVMKIDNPKAGINDSMRSLIDFPIVKSIDQRKVQVKNNASEIHLIDDPKKKSSDDLKVTSMVSLKVNTIKSSKMNVSYNPKVGLLNNSKCFVRDYPIKVKSKEERRAKLRDDHKNTTKNMPEVKLIDNLTVHPHVKTVNNTKYNLMDYPIIVKSKERRKANTTKIQLMDNSKIESKNYPAVRGIKCPQFRIIENPELKSKDKQKIKLMDKHKVNFNDDPKVKSANKLKHTESLDSIIPKSLLKVKKINNKQQEEFTLTEAAAIKLLKKAQKRHYNTRIIGVKSAERISQKLWQKDFYANQPYSFNFKMVPPVESINDTHFYEKRLFDLNLHYYSESKTTLDINKRKNYSILPPLPLHPVAYTKRTNEPGEIVVLNDI